MYTHSLHNSNNVHTHIDITYTSAYTCRYNLHTSTCKHRYTSGYTCVTSEMALTTFWTPFLSTACGVYSCTRESVRRAGRESERESGRAGERESKRARERERASKRRENSLPYTPPIPSKHTLFGPHLSVGKAVVPVATMSASTPAMAPVSPV